MTEDNCIFLNDLQDTLYPDAALYKCSRELPNYHSFNYSMDGNKITLNNQIIIQYQNMHSEKYKNLIKNQESVQTNRYATAM